MYNLFVYGTLMSNIVLASVTGCTRTGEPALLEDYTCYRLRGEVFPAIAAKRGGVVRGLLYRNVTRQALRLVDDYEGAWYVRQMVRVSLSAGRTCHAYTYVLHPRQRSRLIALPWDFDTFRRFHLLRYLRRLTK